MKKLVIAAALAAAGPAALAQEVTLRGVSAFPEKNFQSAGFERFIQRVNAECKGQVQINYLGGGPKVMPTLEVGKALQSGVIDMLNSPGSFYTNVFPESDALKMGQIGIAEQRKNGAFAYINEIWNKKGNMYYLGRAVEGTPFHVYLTKKIDKPELNGLRLRSVSVYQDFFVTSGATPITMPPTDVFTALERGVVDGYGWPITGIFDLGWDKHTKFRVDPGFYNAEVSVLVNLTKWRSLTDAQRGCLEKQMAWLEAQHAEVYGKAVAEEIKRQEAAGIQVIKFEGPQAKQWSDRAVEAGWAGIIKNSPDTGPRLRQLLSKQ